MVSRMREGERKEREAIGKEGPGHSGSLSINWKESLFLATRGGAIALTLPDRTGTFEVGAPFDAQLSEISF